MNEVKFNSSVCTSIKQSQRLLDLGLKPETADMHYMAKTHWGDNWFIPKNERWYCLGLGYQDELRHRYNGTVEVIPAWSLHRLIKMLPSEIKQIDCYYNLIFKKDIIQYEDYGIDVLKSFRDSTNFYDNIVDCIEWLIKEDYFKKEYLKQ